MSSIKHSTTHTTLSIFTLSSADSKNTLFLFFGKFSLKNSFQFNGNIEHFLLTDLLTKLVDLTQHCQLNNHKILYDVVSGITMKWPARCYEQNSSVSSGQRKPAFESTRCFGFFSFCPTLQWHHWLRVYAVLMWVTALRAKSPAIVLRGASAALRRCSDGAVRLLESIKRLKGRNAKGNLSITERHAPATATQAGRSLKKNPSASSTATHWGQELTRDSEPTVKHTSPQQRHL